MHKWCWFPKITFKIGVKSDPHLHLIQVTQSQSVSGICRADWPGTESNTVNLWPFVQELLKLGQWINPGIWSAFWRIRSALSFSSSWSRKLSQLSWARMSVEAGTEAKSTGTDKFSVQHCHPSEQWLDLIPQLSSYYRSCPFSFIRCNSWTQRIACLQSWFQSWTEAIPARWDCRLKHRRSQFTDWVRSTEHKFIDSLVARFSFSDCLWTKCVQKFSYHRLLVYNPTDYYLPFKIESFKIPSSCDCYTAQSQELL